MFGKNKYNRRMPGPVKLVMILALAVLFVFIIGNIIVFLWNEILVELTGVKPMSFWQAIGLFVLSRILFGGFRFGGPPRGKRFYRGAKWREKWMNMNEEEREEFRKKWKERCNKKSED